jgi:hypothetical protein
MKRLLGLFLILASSANAGRELQVDYFNGYLSDFTNYVRNPGIETTELFGITGTGVDLTRNTTAPLIGKADLSLTLNSASDTVDFAIKTLDEGLQDSNCEVRFRYSLTQGASTVQKVQFVDAGVATDLLVSTGTFLPGTNKLAVANVPCGADNTSTKSIRFAQTTGTNTTTLNLDNIYFGAVTNLVDGDLVVLPEQTVPIAVFAVSNTGASMELTDNVATTITFSGETFDTSNSFNSNTFTFPYDTCVRVSHMFRTSGTTMAGLNSISDFTYVATGSGTSVRTRTFPSTTASGRQANFGSAIMCGDKEDTVTFTWRIDYDTAGTDVEEGYLFISGVYPGAMNVPLLVGSVSSNTTGIERVERATVECDASAAITAQSGTWLTAVGNISSGTCALTIAPGIFSSAPQCSVVRSGNTTATNATLLKTHTASATAISVLGSLISSGSSTIAASTDFTFDIHCQGAK